MRTGAKSRINNFVNLYTGNPGWLGYPIEHWTVKEDGFMVAGITHTTYAAPRDSQEINQDQRGDFQSRLA